MELSEKYPEEYFNHWIATLSSMGADLNESGIKEQIEMYKNFEGEDEFRNLQTELKSILENGDLIKFLEIAQDYGLKEIQNKDLQKMAKLIIAQ